MLSNDIPIISVNDEVVDKENKPTRILMIYFNTVINALLNKIDEAPQDGKTYARKDGKWIEI